MSITSKVRDIVRQIRLKLLRRQGDPSTAMAGKWCGTAEDSGWPLSKSCFVCLAVFTVQSMAMQSEDLYIPTEAEK